MGTRKYISSKGDLVIGRVLGKQGEHYHLDISDRFIGLLQYADFEGATKRNRPYLETGTLVYGRIKKSSKHMNPIVSCSSHTNRKTWSSGEAEFMELRGGYLSHCSILLTKFLLSEEGVGLLNTLGSRCKFKIVVGYNGRIWVDSLYPVNTILIVNTLLACEHKAEDERRVLVEKVKKELKRDV